MKAEINSGEAEMEDEEQTSQANRASSPRPALAAFEVSVVGMDWARTVNARTSGQAKSWYFGELQNPWPDIPFTALRCRHVNASPSRDQ